MHLVENHEFVFVLRQVKLRFGELSPVSLGLEIEVDGRPPLRYLKRQGRLSCLAGAEQ